MAIYTGYAGTYASPRSCGVYRFTFDDKTGALGAPQRYVRAPNAKYVSWRDGRLAFPFEEDGRAGLCLLDTRRPADPPAARRLTGARAACFVAQDARSVYTANYHEGTVEIYDAAGGGLALRKRLAFGPEAGCHQVLLCQERLLVPCLELDCVYVFDAAADFAPAGEIAFPPGSGPRHGVWDAARRRLFVVTERSGELFCFRAADGKDAFRLEQIRPLSPAGAPAGQAAAIRLGADGRFLYVSVRETNVIVVLAVSGGKVATVQRISCGGDHPRDFCIAPGGRFLLVANRFSRELVCLPLDPARGALREVCARVPLDEGAGLVFAERQRRPDDPVKNLAAGDPAPPQL